MLKLFAGAFALLLIAAYAAAADGETLRQGYFFVGGQYVETEKGPLMARQMYVEYNRHPDDVRPAHHRSQATDGRAGGEG
jgi:hypothetical protein